MVEEDESFSDMELDCPPKLTYEELKLNVLREPKTAMKRLDYLKTLFYYSKDRKSRLIILIISSINI